MNTSLDKVGDNFIQDLNIGQWEQLRGQQGVRLEAIICTLPQIIIEDPQLRDIDFDTKFEPSGQQKKMQYFEHILKTS